jgi:hypothetical protein
LPSKLTLEEVKRRVLHHHGHTYDVDYSSFVSGDKPVLINCQMHGLFEKKPEDFCPPTDSKRSPKGCPDCGKAKAATSRAIDVTEFKNRLDAVNNASLKVDLSTYRSIKSPVTATCLIHDFTWQVPAIDIAPPIGSKTKPKGCRKCAGRDLDWPEVLVLLKKRHGDFYKYFPETYVNMTTPMRIECPDASHKTLWQKPSVHVSKSGGCQKCGWSRAGEKRRVQKKEILRRCKLIHDNNFDYSEADFGVGLGKQVQIRCRKHPNITFKASFEDHLRFKSGGCKQCASETASERQRLSREEFINRAQQVHGPGTYIYDEVHEFRNLNEVVQIICPRHGRLNPMTAGNHLMGRKHGKVKRGIIGQGCRKCGTEKSAFERSMTFEDFRAKAIDIHDNLYSYDEVIWVSRNVHIQIKCPEHGLFRQRPSDHLSGNGCGKCNSRISKKEREWLESIGVPEEFRQVSMNLGGKQMHFDGFDPINNIAYEFWGDYFHGNPKVYTNPEQITFTGRTIGELYNRTQLKRKLILEAGIKLVEMWESEWDEISS